MIDINNPIRVGDFDFVTCSVESWIQTLEVENNRNSRARVNKMKSVFHEAIAKNQHHSLSEVALGIVEEDFVDPNTGKQYKKGEQRRLDGSTRAWWLHDNPDLWKYFKNGLTCKIHRLSSWQDVEFAYYPYNNVKSSESKKEIIGGLAGRYQWSPRQSVFANGGYSSALDWATRTPTGSHSWESRNVFEAFHMMVDTLRMLDNMPKGSDYTITKPAHPKLKSQAIIAAVLLMLKNNPNNLKLHDFVYQISNITHNDLLKALSDDSAGPVEIIALEWCGLSTQRSGKDKDPWISGNANQTKFSTVIPQMDFLLHWIQRYIENPAKKYNLSGGGVKTMWAGTWEEICSEE